MPSYATTAIALAPRGPSSHYCAFSMGAVVASMPGFYNWILYAPRLLGLIHLWMFGIGVNIVFLPMHGLGLAAMPRRIPDYPTA